MLDRSNLIMDPSDMLIRLIHSLHTGCRVGFRPVLVLLGSFQGSQPTTYESRVSSEARVCSLCKLTSPSMYAQNHSAVAIKNQRAGSLP